MVCIANYDDNNEVIGCTREDGASGGLEFLVDCHFLGLEIVYKAQSELDILTLDKTRTDFRVERDKLIQMADIEIYKLEDNGQDTTAYRTYRQALRDSTVEWVLPVKP